MAAIASAPWTVIILADNQELHRVYNLSPETKLSQVMQSWRDDCRLFGTWTFTSINGDTEYDISNMTLEMVGEMAPHTCAVTLKAQLANKKGVSKIFVYSEGECHEVTAHPNHNLIDILLRVTRGSASFAHDGSSLHLNQSTKQAGIARECVLYETRRQIKVKLSSGVTRTFEMDADSLVYQLIERVSFFEINEEFSLMHRGRNLELYENVKDLKQVIEVARADFVVSFKYRRVSLRTRQSIRFSSFLSQLSVQSQINKQELEEMKFYCTGCQRCVSKSDNEDYEQIMQVHCCEVKSLSLMARPARETSAEQESDDRIKFIHRFYASLLRTPAKTSRDDNRELKSRLTEKGIDYNTITKWVKELRKITRDYDNKIKVLEEENKKLNGDLKATNETIQTRNVELKTERAKNVYLETKIMNHMETLEANINKLLEESKANTESMETRAMKLLEESKDNNETIRAKITNLELNVTRLLEESKDNNETIRAKITNLDLNVTKLLEDSKANNESMKTSTTNTVPMVLAQHGGVKDPRQMGGSAAAPSTLPGPASSRTAVEPRPVPNIDVKLEDVNIRSTRPVYQGVGHVINAENPSRAIREVHPPAANIKLNIKGGSIENSGTIYQGVGCVTNEGKSRRKNRAEE